MTIEVPPQRTHNLMTPQPLVNGSRSLHGCWTCRLRKKKCDENRPACSTCTSLELYCHGFGPRPEWMDRGVLQKQKALEVKQILRHIKSSKFQRQSIQSAQHMRAQSDPLPATEASPLVSSPTQGMDVMQGFALAQHNPHRDLSVNYLSTFNMPALSESSWNDLLHEESFFNQENIISGFNQTLFDSSPDIEIVDLGSSSASPESQEMISSAADLSLDRCKSNIQWAKEFCGENNQIEVDLEAVVTLRGELLDTSTLRKHLSGDSNPTSMNQDESSHPVRGNSVSGPASFGLHDHDSWAAGSSSTSSSSIFCHDMEDQLFMNYLDEVFYIQYPFYDPSNGGRGWLFSILRRTKAAYYAALALSDYHSRLPHYPDILNPRTSPRAKSRYYYRAIQEMQLSLAQASMWSGQTIILRSIESLTSVLQILYWELFHGGTENWQMHLRAANTLIPALVHLVETASVTNSEDDSVIKFLLGSFIWMDIISCASTRSSPFLDLNHKHMLERAGINLKNFNGCANNIMMLIFEIAQLDVWRKKADKTQTLSLKGLVQRGGEIEERLQNGLADLENTTHSSISGGASSRVQHTAEITRVFALAAVTYLHVVVSGAHPELPEIRESVSRTIGAFKGLADAKLLRHLAWPLCITGCLALEEEQGFLREMAMAGGQGMSSETCVEALKIMEECWSMRKAGSSNCDWVSVMNTYRRYVIFG
ncbi:C6 transcription factor protein [Rutstroemia sp. NJR-2017a BBW]|nr:C6 transcription factor protein [Rutstroemia sp. NJR-2017a BBW]